MVEVGLSHEGKSRGLVTPWGIDRSGHSWDFQNIQESGKSTDDKKQTTEKPRPQESKRQDNQEKMFEVPNLGAKTLPMIEKSTEESKKKNQGQVNAEEKPKNYKEGAKALDHEMTQATTVDVRSSKNKVNPAKANQPQNSQMPAPSTARVDERTPLMPDSPTNPDLKRKVIGKVALPRVPKMPEVDVKCFDGMGDGNQGMPSYAKIADGTGQRPNGNENYEQAKLHSQSNHTDPSSLPKKSNFVFGGVNDA